MSKLYWIETWGCQMNEHDSEKMAGVLEGLGYAPAEAVEDADLVLLNTCAIREKAEEKVNQSLHRLGPIKAERPEMIVGVAGCVAQMSGKGVRERIPMVDLVIGPRAASRLPEHLAAVKERRGLVDTTLYQDSLLALDSPPARSMSARRKAYVTIMEGCNKSCSYCIVPTTRGREDSRAFQSVMEEVRALVDEGYIEIEFLGQNVNAYRCPQTRRGLADLLFSAGEVGGVRRLRFTTSHPVHLDGEIIEAMASVDSVCDYLHLPVQSGSSRILKAMRRGYTREGYLRKVEEVRRAIPKVTLSTDMIVGFPGETEEDFEQTLSLVREVAFEQMFSFIFSSRPGTGAALLPSDGVPDARKTARLMELQALQRRIQLEANRRLVGEVVEAIVESPSRRDPEQVAGRTTCSRIVNFSAPGVRAGDVVQVEVTAAGPNSLKGKLMPNPASERVDGAA